jgi:hypothetical protein
MNGDFACWALASVSLGYLWCAAGNKKLVMGADHATHTTNQQSQPQATVLSSVKPSLKRQSHLHYRKHLSQYTKFLKTFQLTNQYTYLFRVD